MVPAHEVPVGVPALPAGYLPVVTGVFVHAGGFVRSGAVVASVAGRPIIVLSGRLPPYRTMSLGDQGTDVLQLRTALRSLGYLGTGSHGDLYDRATARAVARLYASRGFTPIPGGGGSVPLGEVVFVPHLPAVVLGVGISLGETASQGALMTLADPRPRLVGTVPWVEADRLAQGQPAEISFADGSVIRAVLGPTPYESPPSFAQGPPPSPEPAAGGQRRVVLVPRHPLPRRLLGAEGALAIVVAQSPPSSLVVPVTAVFTDPGGRSWLEVIAGGTRSRVMVRLGLVAAGEVVVEPTHGVLRVGDRVLVSAANDGRLGGT